MQYFIDIFKRDQTENDQNTARLVKKNAKTLQALQKHKKRSGEKLKKDEEMQEDQPNEMLQYYSSGESDHDEQYNHFIEEQIQSERLSSIRGSNDILSMAANQGEIARLHNPKSEEDFDEYRLNINHLKVLLASLNVQSEYGCMEIKIYTDLYREFLKLFMHLGKAIRYAYGDIQNKLENILKNQDLMVNKTKMVEEGSSEHLYMEKFILFELKNDLHMLDGDNNKQLLDKKSFEKLKNYQSTSQILVKGGWFFDYLKQIFRLLCQNRDTSMTQISIKAYDMGLAKHHPWIVQKTAKIGMYACKSRQSFFASIIKEQFSVLKIQYTEQMLYADFEIIYKELKVLSKYVKTFCCENSIEYSKKN